MIELFAGPISMAMGNQPMPLRYPLCKRLSKGEVQGFVLTLWSGGDFFFSKNIDFIIIWCTSQLDCPQTIDSPIPPAPLCSSNYPPSPLCCAGVLLVGRCVIFIRRRPSMATTYFCWRFFSSLICCSKQRDNNPPTRSALVAFPLQCPFHRWCQILVGCCVSPLNGGHLRPRVLPSCFFFAN